MTVASDAAQPPRVTYLEDGVTLVRAITFTFQDPTDIVVKRILATGAVIPLASPADYAIAGGAGAVGVLTMTGGGVVGATLQIDRKTPHDQLSLYEAGDTFPADRVEGDFDKLTRIIQELALAILSNDQVRDLIGASLQGSGGISIAVDDVLKKITIAMPDCLMLSGDAQGGGGGGGAAMTTAQVQAIVASMIVASTGIGAVYDAVAEKITFTNTLPETGGALVAGALITITAVGGNWQIATTALDPSYRGLAVVTEAGAFDFVDSHGGKSILYDGGAAAATLQPDATHALSDGWGTVIRHKGTGALTLAIGAGVSIMVNGATAAAATISIAVGGVVTLNRWGVNDFTLTGSKVTAT